MTWGYGNVRFHPDIAPSNSHLSFPVQAFQVTTDLNWNLTTVKVNQIGVTLFQREILNAWFPIIWLCWLCWQRQVHWFQKSLIHLTLVCTLSESHWYSPLPIFIFCFSKIWIYNFWCIRTTREICKSILFFTKRINF